MALPAGIATVTVNIGPGVDFTGAGLGAVSVFFTPSVNEVIWQADGTPIFARPMEVVLDQVDGTGTITLPATDQTGFIDGHGNTITNWTYKVQWKFTDTSFKAPAAFDIQLPQAVGTVDLDLLIPVSGSSGVTVSMPAVISVNGMTGVVTVAGGGGTGASDAVDVTYDHTASGLAATQVQDAIDELNAKLGGILPPSGTADGKSPILSGGLVVWATPAAGGGGGGASDAASVSFTPGDSGLASTNVQDAITELAASWASEETSWLAEARDGVVLESSLGVASGVATLGADGKLTAAQVPAGGGTGGSAYATVEDEGTAVTQQSTINFVGSGVTVTDDAAGSRTTVTIPGSTGGSGGGAASDYEPEGTDPLIWDHGHGVLHGEETIPTYALASLFTLVSGQAVFTYFTAKSDHTGCTKLWIANSSAGPTFTTGKLGIYSVDASGNLTLLASSANDTAMLGSANSVQVETISSVNLTRGTRYAIGILAVGSGTFPKLYCTSTTAALNGAFITGAPVKCGAKTGQTDLAASYLSTDVSPISAHIYAGVK